MTIEETSWSDATAELRTPTNVLVGTEHWQFLRLREHRSCGVTAKWLWDNHQMGLRICYTSLILWPYVYLVVRNCVCVCEFIIFYKTDYIYIWCDCILVVFDDLKSYCITNLFGWWSEAHLLLPSSSSGCHCLGPSSATISGQGLCLQMGYRGTPQIWQLMIINDQFSIFSPN